LGHTVLLQIADHNTITTMKSQSQTHADTIQQLTYTCPVFTVHIYSVNTEHPVQSAFMLHNNSTWNISCIDLEYQFPPTS